MAGNFDRGNFVRFVGHMELHSNYAVVVNIINTNKLTSCLNLVSTAQVFRCQLIGLEICFIVHRHVLCTRTSIFAAYYGIHSIKTNLFVASLCCDSNQFSTVLIFSFISTTLAIHSWICVVAAHTHTNAGDYTLADTLNARAKCYPNTLVMGNNVTTMRKCSFKRNKHADNRKHKEKHWKKTTPSGIGIYGERL